MLSKLTIEFNTFLSIVSASEAIVILTWAAAVDTFYPYLGARSIQVVIKYPQELK